MGCTGSKADKADKQAAESAAVPNADANQAPAAQAPVTASVPAQPAYAPSAGASPFAQAPTASTQGQHAGQAAAAHDDDPGEIRSSEWNALGRPSISAMKGSSNNYRRVSTESKVGFEVDPETAPCAERSTSRLSFSVADSVSMHKIVEVFYDKVLADPALKPFFEGSDMDKIKQHQTKLLNAAFGGKELIYQEDPNIDLRKTHYKLIKDQGLNQGHWDLFFAHLEEALGELPTIPMATRRTALQSIRTTREHFRPVDQADMQSPS